MTYSPCRLDPTGTPQSLPFYHSKKYLRAVRNSHLIIAVTRKGALGLRGCDVCSSTITVEIVALSVSKAAAAGELLIEVLDGSLVDDDQTRPDGRTITVRLGRETLTLVEPHCPGRLAPSDSRSNDLWFRHVALMVSDMYTANERLRAAGVDGISVAPRRLPDRNPVACGIRAFYFSGTGLPLELISFPPDKGDRHRIRSAGQTELGAGPGPHSAFHSGLFVGGSGSRGSRTDPHSTGRSTLSEAHGTVTRPSYSLQFCACSSLRRIC